jgi:aspartate racemase
MSFMRKPARVGILGGMGPAATADFYGKLVGATPAARDQDHIPVLVEADPAVPDRTESFLRGGPSPLPWLRRGAKALEVRGAELIVMPCNTAHLWFDAVALQLSVPLLHIVDAVVEDLLAQLGGRAAHARVGLLATAATVAGGLYPQRAAQDARAQHWQWVLPDAEEQSVLQAGIADVKGGQLARGTERVGRVRDALVRRGIDAVVYGCTEVPLALGGTAPAGLCCSDSTAALARLTVRRAAGPRPLR